jgi:hypothetical protein
MPTTTRATTAEKVAAIKAWATERYETSFGASEIIECFTDAELGELVAHCRTVKGAIAFAGIRCEIRDEQNAGACNEIF